MVVHCPWKKHANADRISRGLCKQCSVEMLEKATVVAAVSWGDDAPKLAGRQEGDSIPGPVEQALNVGAHSERHSGVGVGEHHDKLPWRPVGWIPRS